TSTSTDARCRQALKRGGGASRPFPKKVEDDDRSADARKSSSLFVPSALRHPTPAMARTRIESDTFGPIEVPADRLWGAQTERSRRNFRIGEERLPQSIIRALALIKQAAAEVNHRLGSLDKTRAQTIASAAREVMEGKLDDHFP